MSEKGLALFGWIAKKQVRSFRHREAHRSLRHRRVMQRSIDVRDACRELCGMGLLQRIPSRPSGPGRPKGDSYEVNWTISVLREEADRWNF